MAFSALVQVAGNRSSLDPETYQVVDLSIERWRKSASADIDSNLADTAASSDLGIYGGTHGTNFPFIQSGDLKNNGGVTTRKARMTFRLPHFYVAAGGLEIWAHAGMTNAVASVLATLEFSAYRHSATGAGPDTSIGTSGQLVLTSAQSVNSATWAVYKFALDPRSLAPGDLLDILVSANVNDSATVSEVNIGFRPYLALTAKG